MSLLNLSACELAAELRAGQASVAHHLDAVFARIEEFNPRYVAFSQLRKEAARHDAARLDSLSSEDRARLPLFGVPVAIKDELDVEGVVTTFGGRANSSPARTDSLVVARLKQAGAVIVGKTHMPEFGQAPYTDGAWGGTVKLEKRSRQTVAWANALPDSALRWALKRTARIEQAMRAAFTDIDIMLQPVTPQLPPPTPQLHRHGAAQSFSRSVSACAYTGYWNVSGNPAASVPVGLSAEGLPLAVQVIGAHDRDDLVLDVARQLHVHLAPA